MITATFTDPQGQTWTDAILKIIDQTCSQSKSIRVNHDVNDVANPNENTSENINASMQVAYWPNQAALDAGTSCYLIRNMEASPASTSFHFPLTTMPADYVALELACEAYLQATILPPMQA